MTVPIVIIKQAMLVSPDIYDPYKKQRPIKLPPITTEYAQQTLDKIKNRFMNPWSSLVKGQAKDKLTQYGMGSILKRNGMLPPTGAAYHLF